MRRHQMLQAGTINIPQQCRRSPVFQMAETPGNAALERNGISRAFEHAGIVVEFEHQPVAPREHLADVRRRLTNIRQHAQTLASSGKHVLDRFACIVWNRKRSHLQVANRKGTVAVDDAQIEPGVVLPACRPSTMGKPYREFVLAGQAEYTADVIAMLMRHYNACQIGRLPTQALQTARSFPQAEAAIKHQASSPGLDEQRISCAATTERGKTNHCNCWRSRPRIFFAVSDLSVPPSADRILTTLCCPSSLTWMRYWTLLLTGASLFQKASLDSSPVSLLLRLSASGST